MTRLRAPSLGLARPPSLLFVVAALGAGCATEQQAVRAPRDLARAPLTPDSVTVEPLAFEAGDDGLAFVDGRSGKALSFDAMIDAARRHDVVLVGEQHDQGSHHALQARVIDALADEGDLAVGLEMVPFSLQEPLERYRRGEIDADGLAAAVDWGETWGYDFDLYRPVFEAGRDGRARYVGLNAPRDLVRALAQRGVDGLSEDERRIVPELDLTDEKHRADIYSVFKNHHPPTHAPSEKAFERFYLVQVLWDEAMADRTARALDEGAARVVVLAGNGHVAGYRGIPNRIARRKPDARILTVVPITLGDGEDAHAVVREAVAEGAADIIVVVKPREVLSV